MMKKSKTVFGMVALAALFVFAGCEDATKETPAPPPAPTPAPAMFVAVTGITGVPTGATAGTDLALSGTVAPANATNKIIVWSVANAGTTGASVVGGNALHTTAAGTAKVRATIANGLSATSDYTKDFDVAVAAAGGPLGGTVTISGTAEVRQTLSAVTTGLTGQSGVLHYQWKAGGGNVGADAATYTITAADVGKTITVTVTASGSTGNVTGGPTEAVAVAEPASYTVTFNSQGGSAIEPQTVTVGVVVPYPAEPTKAGAFFDGWYAEAACSTPYNYGAAVNGPITLYALWRTESDMIAGEFGASVPVGNIFEVNNNAATASGQAGWDTSWVKARDAINSGGGGKNYVVKVTGNFSLAGVSSATFVPSNIKILVYSPTDRKIISLSSDGSLFYADANQTLILRNVALQGKTSNAASLAYCNDANAHLVMRPGAEIKDNHGDGGGVRVVGGTFTMSGGAISGNSASLGGGVYVSSTYGGSGYGTFMMSGGTISGNTASGSSYNGLGGGVCVSNSTFTMSGGTISGNTANSGGGVCVVGNTFTMSGGNISGNTASYGGGVYVMRNPFATNARVSGIFTISGGTISGNTASGSGGGVYVSGSNNTFTMKGGAISGNTASYGGGGGVGSSGTFTMSGGAISGNASTDLLDSYGGGGVYISGGTFTMSGGAISGNTALSSSPYRDGFGLGGGVYVTAYISNNGTFTMSGGSISGNTALSGGGVYVGSIYGSSEHGIFIMNSGTISGNTATGRYGGGVTNLGTFMMRGGTIYGSGAAAGLANTGGSLDGSGTYSDGRNIIASGYYTDETLVGH
jgi:hypothetical protein